MKQETVIWVKDLHKSYGRVKAVDSLDFQVSRTECVGLLGPNGAGKTTTMKIIYGKSRADKTGRPGSSQVRVFGLDPGRDSLRIKAMAGVVPQEDNLDTELNVTGNLSVFAKFYGLPEQAVRTRIAELLSFMELEDKARAKIKELSGGMQRRLTIARALLNNPRLLILDEPTTGLDPQVRHLIWNKLRELQEKGVTILLSTHYMEEAFQICNRVIIMDKGKKLLEGKPAELVKTHLEKYVLEFHGNNNKEDLQRCLDYCRKNGIRYEYFQDNLFIYSNEPEELAAMGERLQIHDYHVRTANLEDLFLKVTGRSLNELQ